MGISSPNKETSGMGYTQIISMLPTEAPKKTRLVEFKCENGYIRVLLVHPQMLLDFGFWRFINTPEIFRGAEKPPCEGRGFVTTASGHLLGSFGIGFIFMNPEPFRINKVLSF